ncbi:MAG: hypothetical protein N2651_06750, partial [Fimbriimonadales bacterium]|nr:hypothetical protein [Fimbriimonadales bacterium]
WYTYIIQRASIDPPSEKVDWAQVFGGADKVPSEGTIERYYGVLVEFSAPPRQFQRYLFSQIRREEFKREP